VFARKTGQKADLVVVNPVDLAANPIAAVGFEVQALMNVQPGTIWAGTLEKPPVYAENARKEES
jgi:hypothetical protein